MKKVMDMFDKKSRNNDIKRIVIIGHGFVGKAVDYGFSHQLVKKFIIDPIYGNSVNDLRLNEKDVIFVCVPTPMGQDGSIDTTILDRVMSKLIKKLNPYGNTRIIIKSTITPDVVEKYNRPGVIYNPEFLTERSANEQFVNPEFHIFGGRYEDTSTLELLYKEYSLCSPCPSHHMTIQEASFVKYGINTFLATKVTFFNQLYDAIGDTESNFSRVIKAIGSDSRIGPSHSKVPGFDGKQGFGGACFPKDVSALTKYSKRFTLLEKCVTINNEYRKEYDKDDREILQNIKYD